MGESMGKASIPDAASFEKLGAFYLGREYDAKADDTTDNLLLYDARDLTTHAVCVGMTGSGKTGLCISLLEEAAIDGIPAIAIDPKGDLGNLLLTFPDLRPEDFRPWIDEAEAARKGSTPDEYAQATAELWKSGLAKWGEDGARIRRLREAADFAIYTPGSTAGLPLTVLRSFAAPPAALLEDGDALRERVMASVSGLLGLLGIAADPIKSREHILLSTLLQTAWTAGRDLDLPSLIAQVQSPPVDRIGVMDVEAFYPKQDRLDLSMRLNGLVASPGFAAWLEGEPLEIPRMLWTADGRPRITVLSLAHLSDAERMFFVTVLLNEVVAWMRTQAGTPSLRALLYMDEVFGYFPPTANPPSKTPMLTLLKQARAYGLGVVLATQNPVDLDYKGLANTGTWFLGRLQTERDKLRVIDGLEGASTTSGATFDRQQMERVLSGLKSRVFLMHNVHDDAPMLFHSRWALSYLRGPLTRSQIQTLMADRRAAAAPAPETTGPTLQAAPVPRRQHATRPALPAEAKESFAAVVGGGPAGARLLYRPAVLGTGDLHFANVKAGVDLWDTVSYLAPLGDNPPADIWKESERVTDGHMELDDRPAEAGTFTDLPARATNAKSYASWEKAFKTHLYRDGALTLYKCTDLKLTSEPGESEADFRIRVRQASREKRDEQVDKFRKSYTPKLARLQERIRKAEERVGREASQYDQQKMQTAISMGATVLGALFGRRVASVGTVGRATTTMRGVGRAAREKDDIARARRDLEALHEQLAALEEEFTGETEALDDPSDAAAHEITEQLVRPLKSDITIGRVALSWLPWWVDESGVATPAFR
ncbi:MAG: ATP-binding protein [Gemmatimonadota bacterium]|nr:ATP-binding protein [Gemmatimonadota bacterium]MDH3366965.1 ATP-binding protein [Gemmatimonadota bacterium]MDH5550906.1 ATP-binding protein [Gemmatimonadota bacterium]